MFVALFCAPAWAHGAASPHEGAAIARIGIDDADAIASLRAMGIEPVADHPGPPVVLAIVPASARAWLHASGLPFAIAIDDLQDAIEQERERLRSRDTVPDPFADYRDLAEIEAHLHALAEAAPQRASIASIGHSLEGRPILALRIARAPERARPLVLVNATQHAREWIATMAALWVADALVTREGDASIDALLDAVDVLVVPVVNPDGYAYTWQEDRLWRKNRREPDGVDLNRNYGVAWGGPGSSDNPDSGNYHGEGPFSEPEADAMRQLVARERDLFAQLDVHSFGQLVLSPWGFSVAPPPAEDVLAPLSVRIAAAMSAVHGTEYTPMQGAALYPASGNLPDWSYGEHGVHAFTLELVPQDVEDNAVGFVLGPDPIVPTGEELLAALVALGEIAVHADPLAPGDDGDPQFPESTGEDSTGDDASSSGTMGDPDRSPPASTSGDPSGDPFAPGARIDDVESSCACASADRSAIALLVIAIVIAAVRRRRV